MADKKGSADWKWLVDFHARVLEEQEGERREDQRERVDQSETLDQRAGDLNRFFIDGGGAG
jgi:hypothetical protein